MNKITFYAGFTLCLITTALFAATPPAKTVPIDIEVMRADGTPAADVAVYVSCTNPRALENPILATGHTDAKGRFLSQCQHPNPSGILGAQVLAVAPDGQVGTELVGLVGHSGEPNAVKITLGPSADAQVQVLQSDGQPAANLEVWVTSFTGKQLRTERIPKMGSISKLPGDLWKATTDQEGRCTITRLPKDIGIYFRHADSRFAQPYGKYTSYTGSSAKNDGAVHKITLTKPGALRGRIVDGNNAPAAGVLVTTIETMPYKTAYGDDVRTQEDGTFTLTQIPPSTYRLRLTLYPPLSDVWVSPELKPSAVREGETTDVGDIHLEQAAVVTAEVVDEDTGKKVDEPITFQLPAGRHLLRYRMERFPPKGYHVSGDHLEVTVNVQNGERKTIQFKLRPVKPSDMVTGTVLGLDGKPAPNVSVMLTTEHSWAAAERVKTKDDGTFTIMVPAEAKGVAAIAWDGARSMSDITAAERGHSVTVQLKNDGFARVEGRVTDDSGFPIKGAKVKWSASKLRVSLMENFDHIPDLVPETIETDADGRYVIPRLWTTLDPFIVCSAEGYNREALREVKLLPNKTKQLSFKLTQPGHKVTGIVVDGSGHPIEGAEIRFQGDNQPGLYNNTKTDAKGAFQIGPLIAGQLYISATQITPDFSREIDQFITVPSNEVRLVLPDAEGTVSGTVLDHTGKPVADADITADLLSRKTHTDAQGRFQLTGLVKGWFHITASARNAQSKKIERGTRVKTGTTTLELRLPEHPREAPSRPEQPLNMIGQVAPPLEVATWINSPALAAKAGPKVRIIDFWGLQCGPCLAKLPKVAEFWQAHQREDLEIIAHCGYPADEVREFLAKHSDYTFPISIGVEDSSTWRDYDIRGIPTYVVIDRTGKIISHSHDWQAATLAALAAMKK
ncbi:carboxypeptidase regulatory-like domain-containing protein [Prosthecobacter sp.]|uniref:carboxypeptidase regulatory-like domain-containing protein n=1 Tax=Prosthecobacter sp. TaxID=1965333 RepID=UPI0037841ED6